MQVYIGLLTKHIFVQVGLFKDPHLILASESITWVGHMVFRASGYKAPTFGSKQLQLRLRTYLVFFSRKDRSRCFFVSQMGHVQAKNAPKEKLFTDFDHMKQPMYPLASEPT